MRKEIPSKQLPRIIGVSHVPETLPKAYAVIDALPPRSKVGLEYDSEQYVGGYLKRPYYAKIDDLEKQFFTRLADYAEDNGHTVVWVERPHAFMPPKREEAIRKERLALMHSMEKKDNIVRAIAFSNAQERRKKIERLTSAWRSKVMAKLIQREHWKPTDAVFVGGTHATHLEKILGTESETVTHHDPAEYALSEGLQTVKSNTNAIELALRRKAVKMWKRSALGKRIATQRKRNAKE